MKKVLLWLGMVALFACGMTAAFAATSASSSKSTTTLNNAHNKVTICHATGSRTNPFVVITPDASGVIDGHYPHQDKRDIIPPFDYFQDKVLHHFPGQNWTAEGMAIFNNGCKVPKPGTTTGTTTGGTTTVGTTVTLPGTTVMVTTPAKTVTVTTPGPTTTTTKGSTTTVKKTTKVQKVTKKPVRLTSHRVPKTTG